MKTLVNHLVFRRTYQGLFLLLMIVIPNFALSLMTSYNSQTGLTFTNLESWGIIAINLIIFYLTYLWAKSEGLMTRFRLDVKDAKAIIWGFLTIFFMGVIGSNLMLLTHTNYHAELQKTLTTIPILPIAIGMMTTAFLQEILFRKWIFTWLAPYSKTAVLVSTGLFCLFHMPTNLAYLTLYIGMGFALSMVYQKRENLSASITLHVLWNLYTLGATILVMTNPM
ncbi:CPBP family intramembrane glutamic endopeptidase [uncultured Streptococcus sp.]|uniref:CPBP family intramembrane glutamic endopeptidase n=1 Tax=uncultured Streptococcus sp. TaxID=83427 RepID=UPI0026580D44|nr:type II CAAX endopeptidase family protein [uncultured Streptococcus sp.]